MVERWTVYPKAARSNRVTSECDTDPVRTGVRIRASHTILLAAPKNSCMYNLAQAIQKLTAYQTNQSFGRHSYRKYNRLRGVLKLEVI